jgi:hypothetical protein
MGYPKPSLIMFLKLFQQIRCPSMRVIWMNNKTNVFQWRELC